MAHKITPPLRELLARAASAGWDRGVVAQFQEKPVPVGLGKDVEEIMREHSKAVRACDCFDEIDLLLDRYMKLLAYKRNLLKDKTGLQWKKHGVSCIEMMEATEAKLAIVFVKMRKK